MGAPPQDAIVTSRGLVVGIPKLKNVISHPGGDEESASWGFGGLIQISQENHNF